MDHPRLTTSGPPSIPRVHSRGVWDQGENLLLWVRRGAASVFIDNESQINLRDGDGAWIPMAAGSRWRVVTNPGTVVFPLLTHARATAEELSGPRVFAVPDGWQDWLIYTFNLMITPLASHGHSHDALAQLLSRHRSRPPGKSGNASPQARTIDRPTVPRANGAREVAEELLRNPALDLTVPEWATRVLSSPRTLLRDFRAETGLTFEQWRRSCRVHSAVEYLSAGYGVAAAAARAGFATQNGFTRAFRQQFGLTPHQFSRELSAQRGTRGAASPAAAAHHADQFVRMLSESDVPAVPDKLPAACTPEHANRVHVLIWTYRGSGYLDIGGTHYEQERGVATWIPAGVRHIAGARENSLSLPLGNAATGELQLSEPLQAHFPPSWDDYLLFCSVSARTPIRPEEYRPGHILDLFAEQLALQRALSVPMPSDARARGVALHYLRSVGTSTGPGVGVPGEIRRIFRDQTGMTFERWCYAARMRIARDLIAGGAKPSAVARRVGYAHLSTFSAAFTRFHGLPPREYQEREAGNS